MQEVDLYPDQLRPKRDVLSPRTLMIALGLYILVLGTYASNSYFELYQADKSLASVQSDNERIRELAEETEHIAKTKTLDDTLLVKEKNLKEEIAVKEQQLTLVEVIGAIKNISAYETLKDLQRYHQANMWLEEINILNSGRDIYLRGFATNEGVIPQYLGELQNANAFKNKRFKVIRMNKKEGHRDLEFILSSQLLSGVSARE